MLKSLFPLILILFFHLPYAWADINVPFGPENSQIQASVKYTLVGRYRAYFKKYEGKLIFNPDQHDVKEVFLEIDVNSVQSSFLTLDNIFRSKQILSVKEFPQIIFESHSIVADPKGYQVKGVLNLHGVKKEFLSNFTQEIFTDKETKKESMVLKGNWVIKRKDFGIIWNKFLDKGGIIVGDYINIDWEIKIPVTSLQKDRV